MSENLLPAQKDETIAELYTLRAGLSVIFQNLETIKSLQKNDAANQEKAKQIRQQLEDCDQQIKNEQHNWITSNAHKLSALRRDLANTSATKKQCKDFLDARKRKLIWLFALLGTIFFTFILSIIFSKVGLGDSIFLVILTSFIAGCIFLPLEISNSNLVNSIAESIGTKDLENIKAYIESSTSKIPKLESAIEYFENCPSEPPENESLKKEKARLNDLLQSTLINNQKEKEQNQLKKQQLEKESKELYQALLSGYTSLIVEDDWKNLDLLIFYLETGRAETKKEALQLTDRQLQTNQIAQAIEIASQSISKTMLRATQSLGNLMAQGYSGIGKLIVNYQLDNERLQNALIDHANQSSERMIEAIKTYMPIWI